MLFKICSWEIGKHVRLVSTTFDSLFYYSTVIIFSTPVFVAIFSRIFLGERCGLFNIFTIGLTLLGIIFIVKPPSLFDFEEDKEEKKSNYLLGPIAALASAIFTSSAMILIRVLKGLKDDGLSPDACINLCLSQISIIRLLFATLESFPVFSPSVYFLQRVNFVCRRAQIDI